MKKTSLLTLVSLLVLSACGGSDAPVIDNTTKPAEITNQTGTGFTVHQIVEYDMTTNPDLIAKGMNISHDNYKYEESKWEGDNFNKIEINGQEMEIFPKEKRYDHSILDKETGITFQRDKNTTHKMWVGKTAYATYGLIVDKYKDNYTGENDEAYKACQAAGNCKSHRERVFYQGQPTLDMPSTGTATYKGGSVITLLTSNYVVNGKSSFDVDFGKKSISGKITDTEGHDTVKDITLKAAKIQGNAFKNEQMEGKFYGPKAANVAGYFIDKDQNLHGVFGAEKVTK